MTKTPLGKVAPTPRGEWSAEAAYTNLDIVRHDGKAFIVLRTVTGVTPCDDGENYRLLCADGDTGDGYIKPDSGIPKADLSNDVQTSLSKADTALQEHQDISGKQDKGKITIGNTAYTVTRKALSITDNGITATFYVADIT